MVRSFLGGENHFLPFSFMRSDGAKKYFKNIFLKSSLEFVSLHFQTDPIKKLVVRNLS